MIPDILIAASTLAFADVAIALERFKAPINTPALHFLPLAVFVFLLLYALRFLVPDPGCPATFTFLIPLIIVVLDQAGL